MNTLIDKILNDIHNIGRTDSTLKADDWSVLKKGVKSELLKAIMESLPKENHSCLTHKHIQCAGCAISGVRAKLRELFGEV